MTYFVKQAHPGAEARDAHVRFCQANWNTLAKAAYAYFLKEGRGIVLVQESDFMNKPRGVVVKFQIGYLALSAPNFGKLMEGKDKEAGWCRSYDPARTLLIAFCRTDEGLSSYRIDGIEDRTPQALHDAG
jgi:hypothetical protein